MANGKKRTSMRGVPIPIPVHGLPPRAKYSHPFPSPSELHPGTACVPSLMKHLRLPEQSESRSQSPSHLLQLPWQASLPRLTRAAEAGEERNAAATARMAIPLRPILFRIIVLVD